MHSLAVEAEFTPVLVEWSNPESSPAETSSTWVLVTRNKAFLARPELVLGSEEWPDSMPDLVWTDDYGSLWQVLESEDLSRGLKTFFVVD